MGIFGRFALRSLLRNRGRAIASIIGIALSCAMITAIFTTAASIRSALLDATVQREGAWQVVFRSLSDADVAALRGDPHVAGISRQTEYGVAAAPLSTSERSWSMNPNPGRATRLGLISLSAADDVIAPRPDLESGRYPESAREIIVPDTLLGMRSSAPADTADVRTSGAIALGSTIWLRLGSRVPGASDDGGDHGEPRDAPDGGALAVVGIYPADSVPSDQDGCTVFAGQDGDAAPRASSAWITTTGLDTYEDVRGFAESFARGRGIGAQGASARALGSPIGFHDSLLELEIGSPSWSVRSLFVVPALLLAAIVVIASATLICTSFTISVSERTRQLALLASLGASKRQLRYAVFIEALALAAIGVPAGIALGLLGAQAELRAGGAGMIVLLRAEVSDVSLTIDPAAIGLAVLVSLITVGLGAAVPAVRANRVSPGDALRGAREVRERGGERRRRMRAARRDAGRDLAAASRRGRVRLRLTGVSGLLAHRNRRRAGGRARAATVSLTVSVTLLAVSGWLSSFASSMLDASTRTCDGDIVLSMEQSGRPGESLETMLERLERLRHAVVRVRGARATVSCTTLQLNAHVDPELLQPDPRRLTKTRSPYPLINLDFMDDASWRRYVGDLGLPVDTFCRSERPRAIALNRRLIVYDANNFEYGDVFTRTGTLELVTRVRAHHGGLSYQSLGEDDAGGGRAVYGTVDGGETESIPAEQAILATFPVEIAALSARPPEALESLGRSSGIEILLPLSSLPKIADTARHASDLDAAADAEAAEKPPSSGWIGNDPAPLGDEAGFGRTLRTRCAFQTKDAVGTDRSLREIVRQGAWADAGFSFDVANNAGSDRELRGVLGAARAFAAGFSILMALIAASNVFTTMSTSIMLRRREFAVLRSLGMSTGMFRVMIARECASCALRALACGLLVATGLCYLIFRGAQPALMQLTFMPPPPLSIGAAILVVCCVMLLSVACALHRCRTDAPAEALREEVF